jgi:hypothetical protein
VAPTLSSQYAVVALEMAHQVASRHGVGAATDRESCWPVCKTR